MGLTGYNLRRNRTGQGSVSSPSGTTEKKAEVKVEKKLLVLLELQKLTRRQRLKNLLKSQLKKKKKQATTCSKEQRIWQMKLLIT